MLYTNTSTVDVILGVNSPVGDGIGHSDSVRYPAGGASRYVGVTTVTILLSANLHKRPISRGHTDETLRVLAHWVRGENN